MPYQSKPNDTYVTWQVRLMYWSYQRAKEECERNPPCHMGENMSLEEPGGIPLALLLPHRLPLPLSQAASPVCSPRTDRMG